MFRVVGYVVGTLSAAGASVLLLRHLGVVDYGRYATVMSLIAIVTGLSEVGLTMVGQREYVLRTGNSTRRELTGNILGIQLALAPVSIALALLFAEVAGYGRTLVLGTLIAGTSLIFANAAVTLTIPLNAEIRLGAVTSIEVGTQLLIAAGNALLVLLGARLLAFFGVPLFAALGSAFLAATFLGPRLLCWPRFSSSEWRSLLREAAPMGAAVIVSALYLRTLIVMSSLLTDGVQTGLFATSFRVVALLAGIPALMVGSAFPIMARAAFSDEARLRYVLQRLVEASLLVAGLLVVVVAVGAEPIVRILGGTAYTSAGPVLRIQVFALLGSFVSVVWTSALIAIRRQAALIVVNSIALISVVALGGALIPLYGAMGAAVASVAGEILLAFVSLGLLLRARPSLRPDPRFLTKLAMAAGIASICAAIPSLPPLVTAAISAAVYILAAFSLGALPPEATDALIAWRGRGHGDRIHE